LRESYGAQKQQHTFTLEVIDSSGFEPLPSGKIILRKGRNIYRHGCRRQLWANEEDREIARDEKHKRGEYARQQRAQRLSFREGAMYDLG